MGQLISEDGPRRFYRGLYHGQPVVLKVACEGLVCVWCWYFQAVLYAYRASVPIWLSRSSARSTSPLFGMQIEVEV